MRTFYFISDLHIGGDAAPGVCDFEQELIDFCAGRVARHKRPRMVRFVEELPKTAVGKIQQTAIRELYWAARDRRI